MPTIGSTKSLVCHETFLYDLSEKLYTEVVFVDDQGNVRDPASDRYVFIRNLFDELGDRALVRDQLVNVLLAGRDTTAGTLAYTL